MNDSEEQHLKELVEACKTTEDTIVWMPDSETARIVVAMGNREDEPSMCAYFNRGEYVALYNTGLSQFVLTTPITFNKETIIT